jgi:hypothetical protein
MIGMWNYGVSYAGAEKGDEGMALKILTRVEDMPDVFLYCIWVYCWDGNARAA